MTMRSYLLSALAGFAGMTTASQAATFLYVGNAESQDITILSLNDKNGALSPVATVAVPGPSKPGG